MGQQTQFGAKPVNKDDKRWYQSHDETKHYPNIPIDVDSLQDKYPQILNRCMELRLGFLFQEPQPYNLSLVRKFYANMTKEPRTQSVIVRGIKVNISLFAINRVLDTPKEILVGVFNELCLRPCTKQSDTYLTGRPLYLSGSDIIKGAIISLSYLLT